MPKGGRITSALEIQKSIGRLGRVACYILRDDSWHAAAVGWSEHDGRPVLLTEFVLVEVGSAFSRGKARGKFVELVRSLRDDPATAVGASLSIQAARAGSAL